MHSDSSCVNYVDIKLYLIYDCMPSFLKYGVNSHSLLGQLVVAGTQHINHRFSSHINVTKKKMTEPMLGGGEDCQRAEEDI